MQTLNEVTGVLRMDVSSQGKMIRKGAEVIVREVVDNFKNLSVEVRSSNCMVRLPFYGTCVPQLVLESYLANNRSCVTYYKELQCQEK